MFGHPFSIHPSTVSSLILKTLLSVLPSLLTQFLVIKGIVPFLSVLDSVTLLSGGFFLSVLGWVVPVLGWVVPVLGGIFFLVLFFFCVFFASFFVIFVCTFFGGFLVADVIFIE